MLVVNIVQPITVWYIGLSSKPLVLTFWTQDINWTYIRCLGNFCTQYVRSIYVLCPGGELKSWSTSLLTEIFDLGRARYLLNSRKFQIFIYIGVMYYEQLVF